MNRRQQKKHAARLARRPPAAPPQPSADALAARAYFDYALTGILETDGQWRICRVNPAAVSITGMAAKQLLGRAFDELAAGHADNRPQRHLDLLREQGISQTAWTLTLPNGGEIIIEIASIQVSDDHFLHVFDDVTERRRVAAEIESARQAAEAANRAKSDFLANVSHEIRTPLNGIIGLSQLLLLGELGGEQRSHIERIARSGQTLLTLVNDLLDGAKIEAGKLSFEHLPFSLASVLDELMPLRVQAMRDKALEVVIQCAPEVPPLLAGDPLRLGQCLRNLLGNAIKFTQQGQIRLAINRHSADGQDWLELTVSDTGCGIPAETLSHLFSPFSQADASTARRHGGTGLGLFITRELARGMGGDLSASSTPGSGSRFTLTLPLHAANSELAPPPADATPDEVPQEFRGRRVLVAEDDEVNRIVIGQWLAHAGLSVQFAGDGQAALAHIAAAPPDLVLMDVQMPGLDGLQATRRLREQGITLPIVGLSAGASRAEQDAGLAAGMSDFLGKPIDLDELWGCFTRWLPPLTDSAPAPAESAANRFLDDASALQRAHAAFTQQHGDDAERLAQLHQANDTPALRALSHSLKGAAATLGLQAIASLAAQIESAPTEARPALIDELAHQLHQQTQATR